MPTTLRDPVAVVARSVRAAIARAGRGVYGVACSGGPDSMALLDATISIAGGANVVAIAIDHQLVEGSATAITTVSAFARSLGASSITRAIDVPRRASIEAAAREARYAALSAIAGELGLARIFLGHTARDQAETVLLRILRGTGPAGLAGIPVERGVFARPLLAIERATIDEYIAARAIATVEDPMNVDPRFARVRVRRDILPMLRRENPQLDRALVRLATSSAEWLVAIDAIAAPLATLSDVGTLAVHPAAIRKRAIAIALDRSNIEYAAAHLEAIDDLITSPVRGQRVIELPSARVVRTYDRIEIDPIAPAPSAIVAPEGCTVRTWRSGDRMRPVRLRGRSRKLSDLFADARVPRNLRSAAVVIVRTHDDTIVWAEHIGPAIDAEIELQPR